MKKKTYIILVLIAFKASLYAQNNQLSIDRVDLMPDFPSPYIMRDWETVAVDYDNLVFDSSATEQYFPLTTIAPAGYNYPNNEAIWMDTYVGDKEHGAKGEAINIIPAIVGASLVGVDKTNHLSTNWVEKVKDFYSIKNENYIYLNNSKGNSGGDWWYDTMPNVFFYQLYDLYPDAIDFEMQFKSIADQWLAAVYKMNGSSAPWNIPYMNYRAWDIKNQIPLVDGVKEPESAGAIAWILYQAYKKTGDDSYRIGAELALDFLEGLNDNPSYELQLPYGVLTAAKINAELNGSYDIQKMLDWCFDRGSLRGWGSIVGQWDGKDVSGLIGEANDNGNDYAFLMNGFQQVAALAPLVKYDKRYTKALAKWILNVSNASRLFYSNYLEEEHQSDYSWTSTNDANSVIAYEAIKENWRGVDLFGWGDAKEPPGGGTPWAETNLGLYGSSHVGYLAAVVSKTDVDGILKLNINATDFFAANDFESYVVYNPYSTLKTITIDLGNALIDVYDAMSETTLISSAKGPTTFSIEANSTLFLSYLPSGSNLQEIKGRLMLDDKVVDYNFGYDFAKKFRIRALTSSIEKGEVNVENNFYCTVQTNDEATYSWYINDVAVETNASHAVLPWTPLESGSHTVKVVVSSGEITETESLFFEVLEEKFSAPVIGEFDVEKRYGTPESTIAISVSANDPKELELSYTWTADKGTILNSKERSTSYLLPSEQGVLTLHVEVTNSANLSASKTIKILSIEDDIPERTPIVYLPLNGDTKDFSGNAYKTFVSGTSFVQDAFSNDENALSIVNAEDELGIVNTTDLNFQDGMGLSFFVYFNDFSEERFVVSHGSWQDRWKISVTVAKKMRWTINSENGIVDLDSNSLVEKGVWYHFVAVYDTTTNTMQLFKDGELDSFIEQTGKINKTTKEIAIGKQFVGDTDYFLNGYIDEVKIFNQNIGIQQALKLGTRMNVPSIENQLYAYPNPVVDHFNIQANGSIQKVSVYDVTGKLHKEFNNLIPTDPILNLYRFSVLDFTPGVYSVVIETDTNSEFFRMIKQ